MRRRVSSILLIAGSAVLVYCASILISAALFNWYEGWRLDRSVQQQSPAHQAMPNATRSPAAVHSHEVIGRLEIPRLHVSTVVLEGDDERILNYGAGHVPGTALPDQSGNVGIAAHRDTYFRSLRHIERNDRIRLTTRDGAYNYRVESTEVVSPSDVAVLETSGKPELTLITCYPFRYIGAAPKRFIVHARKVG